MLVVSVVLLIVTFGFATNDFTDDEGCTTFIAVGDGLPSGGALVGRNSDSSTVPYWTEVVIVTYEKGIRCFGTLTSGETYYRQFLNNNGVGQQSNARSGNRTWEGDFNKTIYGDEGFRVLAESTTAEEAIAIAKQIADADGVRVPGGGSRTIFDKKEVYLIEGFGKGDYAIHGPWRNDIISHANYLLAPELRKFQDVPSGLFRGQRAQELLDKRGKYAEETSHLPTGQITPAYMFSICRDAEYRDPKTGGFDQTYKSDDRNIARLGYNTTSRYGIVIEIPKSNEKFLSTMWVAPGFPPFVPFLPFFNGVSTVPPAIGPIATNKTDVFWDLCTVLTYNPAYQAKVQGFWESFEFETLREMNYLFAIWKLYTEQGKTKEAEDLLYSFTNERVELAIDYAKNWVKVIDDAMEVSILDETGKKKSTSSVIYMPEGGLFSGD